MVLKKHCWFLFLYIFLYLWKLLPSTSISQADLLSLSIIYSNQPNLRPDKKLGIGMEIRLNIRFWMGTGIGKGIKIKIGIWMGNCLGIEMAIQTEIGQEIVMGIETYRHTYIARYWAAITVGKTKWQWLTNNCGYGRWSNQLDLIVGKFSSVCVGNFLLASKR